VSDKCALILEQKASYDITFMCDLLELARSTFYEFTTRRASATAVRRGEVTVAVTAVFDTHKRRYGTRRIARELHRSGTPAGLGTIGKSMRTEGLVTVQPRAWKKTTIPSPCCSCAATGSNGVFQTRTPGVRFVGDITYLRSGLAVPRDRHRSVFPAGRRLAAR